MYTAERRRIMNNGEEVREKEEEELPVGSASPTTCTTQFSGGTCPKGCVLVRHTELKLRFCPASYLAHGSDTHMSFFRAKDLSRQPDIWKKASYIVFSIRSVFLLERLCPAACQCMTECYA